MKKMNFIKTLVLCNRYCWALPVSCIDIVLLPFLLSRLNIDAMAIGHVVFGRNRDSLIRCRNHERVHVRQYERWGPLFPVLYLLSSAAALLRGLHPYRDNRFEQEAFRVSGLMETTGLKGPRIP
jgi:hypothetical protein